MNICVLFFCFLRSCAFCAVKSSKLTVIVCALNTMDEMFGMGRAFIFLNNIYSHFKIIQTMHFDKLVCDFSYVTILNNDFKGKICMRIKIVCFFFSFLVIDGIVLCINEQIK